MDNEYSVAFTLTPTQRVLFATGDGSSYTAFNSGPLFSSATSATVFASQPATTSSTIQHGAGTSYPWVSIDSTADTLIYVEGAAAATGQLLGSDLLGVNVYVRNTTVCPSCGSTTCVHGKCLSTGVCTCDEGYSGSDCGTFSCSSHCFASCTSPFHCPKCNSGYTGVNCETGSLLRASTDSLIFRSCLHRKQLSDVHSERDNVRYMQRGDVVRERRHVHDNTAIMRERAVSCDIGQHDGCDCVPVMFVAD